MGSPRWESDLTRELKSQLFETRLERITNILKGKSPKPITKKQKQNIKKHLRPLIIKALKKRYRTELKALKTKSWRISYKSTSETIEAIKKKITKYKEKEGIKARRLIYTLWENKRECTYVGQTERGVAEIVGKKSKKGLYKKANRLRIYLTDKKHLDRYEGIAYHILTPKGKKKPRYNNIQTKNAKKKCPFCKTERKIWREIDKAMVIKQKK